MHAPLKNESVFFFGNRQFQMSVDKLKLSSYFFSLYSCNCCTKPSFIQLVVFVCVYGAIKSIAGSIFGKNFWSKCQLNGIICNLWKMKFVSLPLSFSFQSGKKFFGTHRTRKQQENQKQFIKHLRNGFFYVRHFS